MTTIQIKADDAVVEAALVDEVLTCANCGRLTNWIVTAVNETLCIQCGLERVDAI